MIISTQLLKINLNISGSNEGCSAWYPEHSTDFNHSTSQHGIFPREFDEIRRGQLQRSESKSSGSSGGSNIRVSGMFLLEDF